MAHSKKYDQRLQLRIDQESWDNFERMASDLNVPFLHFCTLSLGIGAKVLHRQTMAFESVPDAAWQNMALGFAKGMDEDKMMQALAKQIETNPAFVKRIAEIDDGSEGLSQEELDRVLIEMKASLKK